MSITRFRARAWRARRLWPTLTGALLLCAPLAAASAQAGTSLRVGDRVRVSRPGPTIGTLTAVDEGTLVLQRADGVTVSIARSAPTRIAVSDGPGPCDGRARVACVLGGAVAGGLLAFGTMYALEPATSDLPSPITYYSAPIGALVGALVGAKVGGERWRAVALPMQLGIAPGVSDAGVPWRVAGLQMRLTF